MHYFYTLFLCIIYVNFQISNRHLLFKKIFLYKFFEISFREKIFLLFLKKSSFSFCFFRKFFYDFSKIFTKFKFIIRL